MTAAHRMFAEEWIRSHDRVKALKAGGYATHNRVSYMGQFRRLIGREDIKAVITAASIKDNRHNMPKDIAQAVKVCWDTIGSEGATARDKSAILGVLTKLEGWDKQEKADDDVKPPTFAYMPFQPVGFGPVVPDEVSV